MVKWEDLKERAIRALDDTNRSNPTWTDADLMDYVNMALNDVSVHTAQDVEYTTTLREAARSMKLPNDALMIGNVLVRQNLRWYVLRRRIIEPGQDLVPTLNFMIYVRDYYIWPRDQINFIGGQLPAGSQVTVQYRTYYDRVERNPDEIRVPRWMEDVLLWLIQAYAMTKPGVNAAQLGQYKTRIDSGGPEDNPLLEYARYCRDQADYILRNHPAQNTLGGTIQ